MDSLVLTLGHNSSAILVRDGEIIAGYETERFTGKKSDSSYPREPIDALMKHHHIDEGCDVYIGQWFLDGSLPVDSNKYIDYSHLHAVCNPTRIFSIGNEFTHHDSHMFSAQAFAGDFAENYHALVMDGFGTMGECISMYHVKRGNGFQLQDRWFGFSNSLGLLYQYATAYMGMKQHNHEYKILAYEVHVDDLKLYNEVRDYASEAAAKRCKNLFDIKIDHTTDPVLSVSALPEIQMQISDELDELCNIFELDKNSEDSRPVISLYIQTVVEQVVKGIFAYYRVENVLLSGGLFYNVKLNNLISKWIPGKICVMPLAGDQGAGLGVYQYYNNNLIWPDHLYWGTRDLDFETEVSGIEIFDSFADAFPTLIEEIEEVGFVNIVRGAMEFGPRALCNTTTLALPKKHVCDVINMINNRTSEMPMAPVCTAEKAEDLFKKLDSVHKSLGYMIITRDYKDRVDEIQYDGIMHHYPHMGLSTGRPQIIDEDMDQDMYDLVSFFGGVLINTSFNYHGVPIVFDKESIEYTHKMQQAKDPSLGFKTIVIKG